MFSFLSGTMATASQRFFAFELGRKNYDQLKKTFSMTMTIYVLIGIVIFILAETVGLWFLNNKMTIPVERMEAANWIYQFAILSFMVTMFGVPYNAAIIAHERMNIYAYMSIIEASLKLTIVYILLVTTFDKLKLYAILIFIVTTLITFICKIYCRIKFDECRFKFYWSKSLFKEIVNYSGWNLFGALANVFNNQGVSIMLNIFFGPIVNAALAIAFQVNSSINQFVQNFIIAVRPQITKYYASGQKEQMLKLILQSSKFSFLLLFIITMPVLLETHFVFTLWLKKTPEYVISFTRFIIISTLIDTLSYPLMAAAQATGKIKRYQATVGGVMLLNLPLSYLFLRLGYPSYIIFVLGIFNSITCLLLRLFLLKKMISLQFVSYFNFVIIPITLSSFFSYLIPCFIFINFDESILRFLVNGFVGLLVSLFVIYILGLSKNEKNYIVEVIKRIIY